MVASRVALLLGLCLTGYRFCALYDKISREDILAHAYAQCRSNKSLPLRRQGARRG